MTTTILPRGVSSTAVYIDRVSRKNKHYFADTAAFSKKPAIDELATIWDECGTSNWDGYGAYPVQSETVNYAYAFIQALPLGFPLPSVSAEPDGNLALDWFQGPYWTITVSISSNSVLYYAALLGDDEPRGSEMFSGEIPDHLLQLIKKVALAKN